MPAIRKYLTAATTDALQNDTYNQVPAGGAIINFFASGDAVTTTVGLRIGSIVLFDESTPNVEAATGVVDNDRDQILFNEVIPAGQLRMPASTVTANLQVLIHLRYLAGLRG